MCAKLHGGHNDVGVLALVLMLTSKSVPYKVYSNFVFPLPRRSQPLVVDFPSGGEFPRIFISLTERKRGATRKGAYPLFVSSLGYSKAGQQSFVSPRRDARHADLIDSGSFRLHAGSRGCYLFSSHVCKIRREEQNNGGSSGYDVTPKERAFSKPKFESKCGRFCIFGPTFSPTGALGFSSCSESVFFLP